MLLSELKSAEHHIKESLRATRALKNFRTVFAQSSDFQRSYVIDDEPQAVLYSYFNGDDEAYVQRHNKNVIGIYFKMPDRFDKALKYVASSKFESIFRHEFQHYLDEIDYKYPYEEFANQDQYINSEVEYSAWFKQLAEPLLAILRASQAGDDLSHFPKIDPQFRNFIRNGQHFSMRDFMAPYDKFSPKYRQRYLRELAAVHKAVVAVEGMSAPYRAKLSNKIALWIHRMTGLEI